MTSPHYIIVLKDDSSYVSNGRVWPQEGNIGSAILRRITDIPDRIANIDGFEPDEYLLYYDGPSEGYINPSDVKTIINVDTLIDEELDQLDKSIEEP